MQKPNNKKNNMRKDKKCNETEKVIKNLDPAERIYQQYK